MKNYTTLKPKRMSITTSEMTGNMPMRRHLVFLPLFAGVPSKKIAEQLVSHFRNGSFSGTDNENYLCASFDPSSELFNSKKYWRGPVWINLNWIIYRGLLNYGYAIEAETIKNDTLFFIKKYGFYEYFEPSKAANESLIKGYGGNNFSWSAALTIDLLTNTINI